MATQPEIWEHINDQGFDENYNFNSTILYKLWEEGSSPEDYDVTDQGESVELMCGQQPGSPPVSTKNIVIQRYIDSGCFGRVHQAVLRSDSGDEINIIIKRAKDKGSDTLETESKWYKLLPKDEKTQPRVFPQLLFAAMNGGSIMLGMEYMTDTNLHDLIESEDDINEHGELVGLGWKTNYQERDIHLIPVLEQLIEANRYMKKHHIHHLDIKPKNIIYCVNENSHNYQRLWLIDFGSALQTESISDAETYTEPLGGLTRHYAAPELLLKQDSLVGGKPVYYIHHTSDIYSVAATCYHLLFAQIPWSNYQTLFPQYRDFQEACKVESGKTELQKYIHNEPHLPEQISRLLIGMLEVDFTKRLTQEHIEEMIEVFKMNLGNHLNEHGDWATQDDLDELAEDGELQYEDGYA